MEEVIRKEKFSNQACRFIQEGIISGEIRSGERLVETKVAKQLGISQSPVREALRELEVMGLVEIRPYSGCFVLPMDEKKLEQIYSLRALLETFAAREGITQITDEALDNMEQTLRNMESAADAEDKLELCSYDVEFHGTIVASANNPMLEKMWKLVGAPQWTAVTIGMHDNMHYFPKSHRKLMQLARARDVEGVVAELEQHFRAVRESVVEGMKSKRGSTN